MTQVKIVPYTNGTGETTTGRIILREDNVTMFDSNSYFHLLKTSNLDLTIVTSVNQDYVNLRDKSILLYKTSLVLENLTILSEYLDVDSNYITIRAYQLQEKFVVFQDMLIQVSGGILKSTDPMEMHITNVSIDLYKSQFGISVEATWNYPEAVLDGGLYGDNITIYDSQEKEVMLNYYVLIYSGPGHMVLNNAKVNTYTTLANNVPIIIMLYSTNWDPDITTTQYGNITNSYFTMPENPDGSRVLTNSMAPQAALSARQAVLYFTDNLIENVKDAYYTIMWLASFPTTVLHCKNNVYRNATSREAVLRTGTLQFYSENDLFTDIENSQSNIFMIEPASLVVISNLTMENIYSPDYSYGRHIRVEVFPGGYISIDTVTIRNVTSGKNSVFSFLETFSSTFTLKNALFENIETTGEYPIVTGINIQGFTMQNFTFSNIYKADQDDNTNILIDFELFDLGTSGNFILSDVVIKNSTVPFFSLSSIKNPDSSTSQLTLTNITFHDWNFEFPEDLISLNYNQPAAGLVTTFSNSAFYNLKFVRGGNLLDIHQQDGTQVEVSNIAITNVTGGVIQVDSFTQSSLTNSTRVLITNLTATNLNQESQHLFMVQKAGIIKIVDSTFTGINNLFQGSVAYVQDRGSLLEIHDSVFQNNTSLKAALFYIESIGVLKWTNCTITNNFALEASVFYSFGDGQFLFSNSLIENNYAMSIKVGEILDSSSESEINNCDIKNNYLLTYDEIQLEIDSCDKLCFLTENIKSEITRMMDQNLIDDQPHTFQVILGNLKIVNSTEITNDDYFMSMFISTVTIDTAVIENVTSTGPFIEGASSTFILSNSTVKNATNSSKQSIQSKHN
jgi:hypothetical protein